MIPMVLANRGIGRNEMSQLAALLVAAAVAALFGIIAYLLKGRFDGQDIEIGRLRAQVDVNTQALIKLNESQKAVIVSQTVITQAHSKLVDDTEDLEDKTGQLTLATQRLQDRLEAHTEFQQRLREETDHGRRGRLQSTE